MADRPDRSTPRLGWRSPDAAVLGVFVAAGGYKLATHEMFRDELQAWAIARASASVGQLVTNMRYEGHPPLWASLLFLVSRFSSDPRTMQILHLAIATATVYTVLRFAPFPTWQRRAFAFGYFPFFEYLNISRSYALGLLGVMVVSALAWRRQPRWIAIGAVLSLLALTSVYGWILAVVLGLAIAGHRWTDSRTRTDPGAFIAGTALLGAGLVASLVAMIPPGDYSVGPRPGPLWTFERGRLLLSQVWAAFAPIPPPRRQFLNRDVVSTYIPHGTTVAAMLGVGLIVGVAILVRRHRLPLTLWLGGVLGLLAAFSLVYEGGIRHWGHLFVLLVATAWASTSLALDSNRIPAGGLGRFLGAVLIVQVVGGAVATAADIALPFSQSGRAAAAIASGPLASAPLVGHDDFAAAAVGAWLDRQVRFPQADRSGRFIVWDRRRDCPVTPAACVTADDVVADAGRLAVLHGRPVVLIANHPIHHGAAQLLRSFTGGVIADEDLWLYQVG